jgi:hypothetical protein
MQQEKAGTDGLEVSSLVPPSIVVKFLPEPPVCTYAGGDGRG